MYSVDPGEQPLHGGGSDCRRILCNYGYWRCQLICECEFIEADERHRPSRPQASAVTPV